MNDGIGERNPIVKSYLGGTNRRLTLPTGYWMGAVLGSLQVEAGVAVTICGTETALPNSAEQPVCMVTVHCCRHFAALI